MTRKTEAFLALLVVFLVPQIFLVLPDHVRVVWNATYLGWMTGAFGGMLWVVSEYSMNLKDIVLTPDERHWAQISGRMLMGAFSGATANALLSSPHPLINTTEPQQAALGLIAGYSGVFISLLATQLNRWVEQKTKGALPPG